MQNDCFRTCFVQERLVNLIIMQCFETNLTLCFLAHAGPYIGIEHVGALSSLEEVLLYGNAAAGLCSILLC